MVIIFWVDVDNDSHHNITIMPGRKYYYTQNSGPAHTILEGVGMATKWYNVRNLRCLELPEDNDFERKLQIQLRNRF